MREKKEDEDDFEGSVERAKREDEHIFSRQVMCNSSMEPTAAWNKCTEEQIFLLIIFS